MTKLTCVRCNQSKDQSCFYKRGDSKKPRSECKDCLKIYFQERYKQRKQEAISLLGSKCFDCKTSFPDVCYDFHHLDPNTKLYEWKEMRQISKEKYLAELKKCILLCSNCHRIRHDDLLGKWAKLLS